MKPFLKRTRFLSVVLAITATILFISTAAGDLQGDRPLSEGLFSWVAPVQAQPTRLRRVSPMALSAQVYEQLPSLPLENQYISSDTGAAAADNTLISRIIRYHVYIKKRPTNFRLDWKLTLADYLGAFERISADGYPDYGLRENPLEGDRTLIQALSREQRDQLVNALYETFTAAAEAVPAQ